MDVVIRPAIITDIQKISALSQQLGYESTIDDTRNYLAALLLSDTEKIYVATLKDVVVGWMQLSYVLRLESGYFCEITGLVVDEAIRSNGVGQQLISFAKEWCKQKACHKLRVRTNAKRLRTHQFYENAGFELLKEQKVYELNLY